MKNTVSNYTGKLIRVLQDIEGQWAGIEKLALALQAAWKSGKRLYLCGNGGSAANAVHLANDFNYGINKKTAIGMRVEALSANTAVVTCIANDVGYDSIFSQQLRVKAAEGDVLLAFSGSGHSPNIIRALETGNEMGMKTFAVLGYTGGKCKQIAQCPIHFPVDDMQISEDLQTVVGHMCMQWLSENG